MTPESTHSLDLIRNQIGFGALGGMQKAAQGMGETTKAGTDAATVSEQERKRWKASLDFEAMFLSQMYKAMRQTAANAGSELTEASPGREIFTEMLDNQYAGLHAKSPLESGDQGLHNAVTGASNSMASQIYRAMCRKEGATLPSPAVPGLNHMPAHPLAKAAATSLPLTEEKLNPIVDLASKTYDVAASLLKSVIRAESANQPRAVSPAGAKGLMQLMDSTARDLGVKDVFNVHENVLAGAKYLKQMLNRFDGNEEKALAAYNSGPATVERFGGIPPYTETRDYVKKVLKHKNELDAAAAVEPESKP